MREDEIERKASVMVNMGEDRYAVLLYVDRTEVWKSDCLGAYNLYKSSGKKTFRNRALRGLFE